VATLPTPEDSARAILAIFKAHNMRPNGMLMVGQVNTQFLTNGGKAADYAAGLQYAVHKDWLIMTRSSMLLLTNAGFTEM
jgi:hypothetical protein